MCFHVRAFNQASHACMHAWAHVCAESGCVWVDGRMHACMHASMCLDEWACGVPARMCVRVRMYATHACMPSMLCLCRVGMRAHVCHGMYACVRACIYAFLMYVCGHACMCVWACVPWYVCMRACMHICNFLCAYVGMHVCMRGHVCHGMYACVRACIYAIFMYVWGRA
jgi:hypothetical protein